MYLPRADRSFGSDYTYMQLFELERERESGMVLQQMYEVDRAHWKSLDSKERRCDSENKNYVTKCITKFLENSIGCSMGMPESNKEVDR